MEALYERVGGLEVHKKRGGACRRRFTSSGRVDKEVATVGTTTPQLLALLEGRQAWQGTPVARASPGGYWQPGGNILAGHGELLWGNARPVKTVPGRKTAVKDAEGIAPLRQ